MANERMLPDQRIEPVTSWLPVGRASDWATGHCKTTNNSDSHFDNSTDQYFALAIIIWATSRENVSSEIFDQVSFEPACSATEAS